MANKKHIIEYFIDKMNENIDLTDILDENGETVYFSTPFVPVVFKVNDSGKISTLLDLDTPIPFQELPKKIIYVNFSTPELEKENIHNHELTEQEISDDNIILHPLESWVGAVGISMFISVENLDNYSLIYDKITEFHEEFIFNKTETFRIFGETSQPRSVELVSSNIVDNEGRRNINRYDHKMISFAIAMNVSNKNISRSNRRRIQYKTIVIVDEVPVVKWEELNLLDKTLSFGKAFTDDTNSGELITTVEPDVATRKIAFAVVYDYDSEFIQKVEEEIYADIDEGNIDNTFVLKLIRELPNGTEYPQTLNMSLASVGENNQSNFSVLALSFTEIKDV